MMTTLPLLTTLRRSSVACTTVCRSQSGRARVSLTARSLTSSSPRTNGAAPASTTATSTSYPYDANTAHLTGTNAELSKQHTLVQSRDLSTSTRRRRRRIDGAGPGAGDQMSSDSESSGMGEGEETLPSKPSAIIKDPTMFEEAGKAFLTRTFEALEPMKAHNEVFTMTRSMTEQGENLTIKLKPGEGQYILQVDVNVCTLSLTSPMSGNHVYVLCGYTGQFVGMNDGHICEGMIVRDMIRHCNGMPQF